MTVATLRPNATDFAGGLALTGAATLHAALSDNSDASYATGTTTTVGKVQLGTFTLPANAVVSQTRVRMRARGISGSMEMVVVAFRNDSSPNCGVARLNGNNASIVDVTGAWNLFALPNTQALIDSSYLSVSTSIAGDARVHEAYFDVQYVAQPVTVVTAVTPDPYTASNLVPIAWTNTLDSDGGAQTRRRVKVFSAAQYGIGGFDPETSPFTWDSGEVVTGLQSTTTVALTTGVTYRAYVKVAQTVNGASHWSAWAFDQFQVSVTTSDVLSVTVAPVNASARIDVTVNRNTGSAAWNFVEVQRSTDAGATWSDVRSATYADSTGNANVFTVSDWETGNGQATLYRARATRIVSGLPIAGAWVSSTSTSWTSAAAWLKSPLTPANNQAVIIETPFTSQERTVRNGVFQVIGRRAPIVISDVLSAPSSAVLIRTDTPTQLTAMLTLLADSVLLLQQLPESLAGPDRSGAQYISVVDVSENQRVPFYTDSRLWNVTFVEVDAPGDPDASAP